MGLSVLFARAVLAEVRSRGLDPNLMLLRVGLSPDRLADIRQTLSIDEAHALLSEALAQTDDPGFGLQMGLQTPFHGLHLLGHLMLAQRTMRDALVVLRRYSALLTEGLRFDVIECGPVALLTCEPQVQLGDSTRCTVDFVLALSVRFGAQFLGQPGWVERVGLQHAAPPYAERYQAACSCPVLFGEQINSIAFARELLDVRQPYADDSMSALLAETADRLLTEQAASYTVSQRIRTILRYERDLHELGLERIASRCGLSARSLRRHLSGEGVSLTTLIDEARCALSCDELRRPDATIKDTSMRVGFSEPSAFYRAFRRWTGLTPLEYRRFHFRQDALEGPAEATH